MSTLRRLDAARKYGRSIQPIHDLQPGDATIAPEDVLAVLDVSEIDADAQPKRVTISGVCSAVADNIVAGNDKQVQFNVNGTSFGGDADFTWDENTNVLRVNGTVDSNVLVVTSGTAAAPSVSFSGFSNTGLYLSGPDKLSVATSGLSQSTFDTTGLLIGTASRTANGGVLQVSNGITFPATQSACSDANTLDDYEEGVWTPTVTGGSTNPTQSYSVRLGRYVKIGRSIHIVCRVKMASSGVSGGTGQLIITGLPFSSPNITSQYWGVTVTESTALAGKPSGGTITPQDTIIYMTRDSGSAAADAADVTNNSSIVFFGLYEI